jgi:hypothetical protein
MVVIEWGRRRREEVGGVADVDALLDQIAAEARKSGKPQDVQVTLGDAGTLGVVVGSERSALNHTPSHRDPPYMVSVGTENRDDPFIFYVAGDHYSEALWRNTIPPDVARDAVRHFVKTGDLSPSVAWEEV